MRRSESAAPSPLSQFKFISTLPLVHSVSLRIYSIPVRTKQWLAARSDNTPLPAFSAIPGKFFVYCLPTIPWMTPFNLFTSYRIGLFLDIHRISYCSRKVSLWPDDMSQSYLYSALLLCSSNVRLLCIHCRQSLPFTTIHCSYVDYLLEFGLHPLAERLR